MAGARQKKSRSFAPLLLIRGLPSAASLMALTVAAVLVAAPAPEAVAQSGTWSAVSGGNWSDAANWQGGTIASGSGNAATFSLATGTTVTLDSNYTLQSLSFSTANWTLGGSGTLTFAGGGTRSISAPNSGSVTVSAALSGTTWTKFGNGTLVLTNASNNNGRITVNNGTLQAADSTVYAAGDQNITSTVMGNNGVGLGNVTLQLRYNGQNDATSQVLAMTTAAGDVSIGGTPTIDVNRQGGSGSNKTIGMRNLTTTANATLNITGGNGYSLQVGSVTLNNGNNLTLNPTTAAVIFTGNVSGFGANARTITLDGTASGNSFSGNIGNATGVVSLAKANSSSWTLSGSNTFSGSTSITGGLLEVASTGQFTATTGITLDGSGAEFRYNSATALARPFTLTQGTLSGTGTINTAVSVGTNAILSPGNSPGTQAFSAGLTWAPGGTYRWELAALTGVPGTTWDLLDVTAGSFDLSSLGAAEGSRFTLDLATLGAGGAPGPLAGGYDGGTYSFLIADFGGAGFTVPGTYSTAAGSDLTPLFSLNLANWQGPQPDAGNMSVRVNSSGTGIELIIVPEPTALVLCGIGAGVILATARRRHVPRSDVGRDRVRGYLESRPFPHFEPCPDEAGMLVRIDEVIFDNTHLARPFRLEAVCEQGRRIGP
jgi:autotransporter-associated beta strand protein